MNKVIIGVLILLGIIIALSVCNLFSSDKQKVSIPKHITVADQQKNVEKTVQLFAHQADSLNAHAANMDAALKQTKQQLETAKLQQLQLRSQVNKLVEQQHTLVNKKDTVGFYSNADSLANKVNDLVIANDKQQFICEAVADNLTAQVHNRDSLITIKNNENGFLNTTLSQSFSQQQLLENQVKALNKQIRRKRLISKVQSVGLVALSAFALKLLVK